MGDAHAHSVARQMISSHVGGRNFSFCKSTAHPISLLQQPHARYTFDGAPTLVDGVKGESTNFQSGQWIGFSGTDLDAVIDLGQISYAKIPKPSLVFRCSESGAGRPKSLAS